MYICVYTEHLYDDKLNTRHSIQSGRKLMFLRNKRVNRRSFGRRRGQMKLKTTGMVIFRSYRESEVGHSFSSSGTRGQMFLHPQLS